AERGDEILDARIVRSPRLVSHVEEGDRSRERGAKESHPAVGCVRRGPRILERRPRAVLPGAAKAPWHPAGGRALARTLVALGSGEIASVEAPQRRPDRALVAGPDELDALPVREPMVTLGEVVPVIERDLARVEEDHRIEGVGVGEGEVEELE